MSIYCITFLIVPNNSIEMESILCHLLQQLGPFGSFGNLSGVDAYLSQLQGICANFYWQPWQSCKEVDKPYAAFSHRLQYRVASEAVEVVKAVDNYKFLRTLQVFISVGN